jgi:hypothetical protein
MAHQRATDQAVCARELQYALIASPHHPYRRSYAAEYFHLVAPGTWDGPRKEERDHSTWFPQDQVNKDKHLFFTHLLIL